MAEANPEMTFLEKAEIEKLLMFWLVMTYLSRFYV